MLARSVGFLQSEREPDAGSGSRRGARGGAEPVEGQRGAHGLGVVGVGEVVADRLGDAGQPVAHRVGVHDQRAGGALDALGAVEVGRRGVEQGAARALGQRAHDPRDQRAARRQVAEQGPLGEQVVGVHRPRCAGPGGRRAVPGDRGPGAAAGGEQVRHDRADHERAVAEVRVEGGGQRHRVGDAAADADDPRPVDRDEQLDAGAPGRAVQVGEHRGGRAGRGRADDHHDLGDRAPAERGRPRLHRLVGLAADDGVDDERLEPGVPRAAGLGGLGVDLGGGEGDLAAVAQHRLAGQVALAGGRQVGDLALDDVDDGADQVEGLGQRDRPGQLARGGAEDVGGDGRLGLVAAEPVEERGDAGLRDQPHPRAVLGRQRPVPLVVGLHLLHRGGAEVTGGAGDPGAGGGRRRRAGRTAYGECICMPCTTGPVEPAGQSVPDSIAARSSASSSPPCASGLSVIWS